VEGDLPSGGTVHESVVQGLRRSYHFINNGGYVWSGVYQVQLIGGVPKLVMISPDNPNYAGFVWNIDSQTHLTLTNAGDGAIYAGSTMTR